MERFLQLGPDIVKLWQRCGGDYLNGVKNTLILAVSTVAICLVVSVPAAYVFSRKRFRGRKPILKILVLLYI